MMCLFTQSGIQTQKREYMGAFTSHKEGERKMLSYLFNNVFTYKIDNKD